MHYSTEKNQRISWH